MCLESNDFIACIYNLMFLQVIKVNKVSCFFLLLLDPTYSKFRPTFSQNPIAHVRMIFLYYDFLFSICPKSSDNPSFCRFSERGDKILSFMCLNFLPKFFLSL
jgi:hypothetical protein